MVARNGYFTPAQERLLTQAIAEAEEGNRGEIRVHVEAECPADDPVERAAALFEELGMSATEDDTGVLLYIATASRACAVFAGEGVVGAEEPAFWNEVAEAIALGFGRKDPVAGIEMALLRLGQLLRRVVPGEDAAGNELPDLVTTS
jgi:uncharacterized membrane protein